MGQAYGTLRCLSRLCRCGAVAGLCTRLRPLRACTMYCVLSVLPLRLPWLVSLCWCVKAVAMSFFSLAWAVGLSRTSTPRSGRWLPP